MLHVRKDKKLELRLKKHRATAAAASKTRAKPLRVPAYKQQEDYCGPASLKIVCDFHGRNYTEEYLGKVCKTKKGLGTTEHNLIEGAEKLGAMVFATHNGDITDLRFFLHEHRLPVIVAWYSPIRPRFKRYREGTDYPWGHFSVVYHVSSTHVYLLDPDTGKRLRMSIKRFKYLWWDTDSVRNIGIRHWFMVVKFEESGGTKAA